MCGDEIFKHRETFTEVRDNWAFDNFTGRLGHQTAHTTELFDLGFVTPRTGIDHHEERRCLFLTFVVLDLAIEGVGDGVGGLCPDIDDFLIALAVGDDTVAVLLRNFFDLCVCVGEDFWFLFRNEHVDDTDRDTGTHRFHEAEGFQFIENLNCFLLTSGLSAAPDDVTDLFLADGFVVETEFKWPNFVETNATRSGLDDFEIFFTVNRLLTEVLVTDTDPRMVIDLA